MKFISWGIETEKSAGDACAYEIFTHETSGAIESHQMILEGVTRLLGLIVDSMPEEQQIKIVDDFCVYMERVK